MNIEPTSVPNTIRPVRAATQKIRRDAMARSKSGFGARFCRQKKRMNATTLTTSTMIPKRRFAGTDTKCRPSVRSPIAMTDSTPPRWSTGFCTSPSLRGIKNTASTSATTAIGTVSENADPHP